jgi:hypothetical protein
MGFMSKLKDKIQKLDLHEAHDQPVHVQQTRNNDDEEVKEEEDEQQHEEHEGQQHVEQGDQEEDEEDDSQQRVHNGDEDDEETYDQAASEDADDDDIQTATYNGGQNESNEYEEEDDDDNTNDVANNGVDEDEEDAEQFEENEEDENTVYANGMATNGDDDEEDGEEARDLNEVEDEDDEDEDNTDPRVQPVEEEEDDGDIEEGSREITDGEEENEDVTTTTHDAAQDKKQAAMQRQIDDLREQLSEHPRTEDASDAEKQDASILLMKALVAQVFNQKTSPEEPEISHHDVDHQFEQGDVSYSLPFRFKSSLCRTERLNIFLLPLRMLTGRTTQQPQDFNVIITTTDSNGTPYTLVARFDTGADDNFIKEEVVRSHHIAVALLEGPATFNTGGGAANASGIATLHYRAGQDAKLYSQDFNVMDTQFKEDVVLGKKFMEESHAIMLNPNFAHPTDPPDFLLIEQDTATKDQEQAFDAKVKQRNEEHKAAYLARTGRDAGGKGPKKVVKKK